MDRVAGRHEKNLQLTPALRRRWLRLQSVWWMPLRGGWCSGLKLMRSCAKTSHQQRTGVEALPALWAAGREPTSEAAGWLALELLASVTNGTADDGLVIKAGAIDVAIQTLSAMADVLSERNLARGGLAWCTPSSSWGQLLAALLARDAKLFRQCGPGGRTDSTAGGAAPASSAASSAEGGAGCVAVSPLVGQSPELALGAVAALLSLTTALMRGGAAAWASPTKAAGLAVAARDLVERCGGLDPGSSGPDGMSRRLLLRGAKATSASAATAAWQVTRIMDTNHGPHLRMRSTNHLGWWLLQRSRAPKKRCSPSSPSSMPASTEGTRRASRAPQRSGGSSSWRP